jgi:hypothetical protein
VGPLTVAYFAERPLAGVRDRNSTWGPKQVRNRRGMIAYILAPLILAPTIRPLEAIWSILHNLFASISSILVCVAPGLRPMRRARSLAIETAGTKVS